MVIGASLMVTGIAFAAKAPALNIANTLPVGDYTLTKVTDSDNKAVCYIVTREWIKSVVSLTASISCVK